MPSPVTKCRSRETFCAQGKPTRDGLVSRSGPSAANERLRSGKIRCAGMAQCDATKTPSGACGTKNGYEGDAFTLHDESQTLSFMKKIPLPPKTAHINSDILICFHRGFIMMLPPPQ